MQFAQRQRLYRWGWKPLAGGLAVGLLLGFAGPFGSYPGMPTATRYAFWVGLSVVGILCALAADAVLPADKPKSRLGRVLAVALASSVPMTFVVAWTVTLIQPGRIYGPLQLFALFWGVAAVQVMIVYATAAVAVVRREAAAVTAVPEAPNSETVADAPRALAHEVVPPPAPRYPDAILAKLPPGIGRDIRALETEDHYLRVHAEAGSGLILMRMVDAVAVIDAGLGAQVHRRWWVADGAVVGLRNEGQKLSLQLSDGSIVPVGRTFGAAVRERFGKRVAAETAVQDE